MILAKEKLLAISIAHKLTFILLKLFHWCSQAHTSTGVLHFFRLAPKQLQLHVSRAHTIFTSRVHNRKTSVSIQFDVRSACTLIAYFVIVS